MRPATSMRSAWASHNEKIELGLMAPGLEKQPGFLQAAYDGKGVWLSFNVADMDAEYERLFGAGAPVEAPPQGRLWGERQFVIRDPNGFVVDLVKSIPLDPGFCASVRRFRRRRAITADQMA